MWGGGIGLVPKPIPTPPSKKKNPSYSRTVEEEPNHMDHLDK